MINPTTYGDDYASVNIARDHSGLVEARKENGVFVPTTYDLKVTMSDGEVLPASYTVYYQSEIINSDFESPEIFQTDNYAFFPNGWPELYWKTTAPGANGMLTRDIEYGYPSRTNGSTSFGVTRAASGDKMAELNAEDFGALYQDIITAPGEEVTWRFAHAPRQDQQGWSRDTSNAMFIVLGPTETAQKLLKADLNALGAAAKAKAGANNAAFLGGTASVDVEYNGSVYTVWYHNAGTYSQNGTHSIYNEANNYGWTNLEGEYITPEGQYRTRLFFMSEESSGSNAKSSAGNLIDLAKGGQYRKYLIEYYTEIIPDGETEVKKEKIKSVEGEALMHASVKLTDLIDYMTRQNDPYYLHKIMINGGNYPYNIRYEGDASLYIEKYEDAPGFKRADYGDYYIVMQVYLREVATTVQTQLIFPEGMTDAQKLSLIQSGYETQVKVSNNGSILDIGTAHITNRDPSGAYTAYHYFDKDIYLTKGTTYNIEQTYSSGILGLNLVSTTYHTRYYVKGEAQELVEGANIELSDTKGYAEVFIANKYEEKMTTIYYKAIGNGKVAFADGSGDLEFMDTPTEKLAFYTGKAKGAKVYAGVGATFTGWFKDEACTKPVTAADGVVGADNSFRPNANIINDDVTFYAKFETGSIVIKRENANPGQSFVYLITSSDVSMYVSLQCDENGIGQVVVLEAALGTYTVTELEDWSWRHDGTTQEKSHQGTVRKLEFEFSGPVDRDKWLNACGKISSKTG